MPQNGPKMAKNYQKWPKVAQILPQMAQNGPRMTQNDPEWPKKFLTEKAIPQIFSLLECMSSSSSCSELWVGLSPGSEYITSLIFQQGRHIIGIAQNIPIKGAI